MKKQLLFIALALLATVSAKAQNEAMGMLKSYTPSPENLESRKQFQDMKFGMFIHWGIYSELGAGEWVMHERKIPYDNYKRLASFFRPEDFNAKEWVALAKAAGMKYITITSRHHDGFSMFGTKASPYNIVDATPYHKDPLMELAKECQKEGIELHFYYSLLDWGRPDYAFGHPIVDGKPVGGDWDSYVNFMKTQLTELISNYPAVKGIWFDGEWERRTVNWHFDEIYPLIHKINSSVLIGNNHHLAPLVGEDFQMFEKDLPGGNTTGFAPESKVGELPLETCETINDSWGYNITDRDYKSVKQIIHYLVTDAGMNANFLLNVGPMPNGKIQKEFVDTLTKVGQWIQKNGESIYGTRGNLIAPQPWGVVIAKGSVIYAHILKNPAEDYILIPSLSKKITKAEAFGNGNALKFKQQAEGVFIYTKGLEADPYDTIIKITTN